LAGRIGTVPMIPAGSAAPANILGRMPTDPPTAPPTDGQRAAKRIRELAQRAIGPAVYSAATPLQVSVHQCAERIGAEDARGRVFVPTEIGWRWGPVWSTAWFRVRGIVPAMMRGRRVVLRFDCGTEALLWDEGVPRQGFDRNRDAAGLLERAESGEPIDLLVEAACNHPLGVATTGLFWEPPEFHERWSGENPGCLARCELAVFDEEAWRLLRTVEFACQILELTPPTVDEAAVAAAIETALSGLQGGLTAEQSAEARTAVESALRATPGPASADRPRCFAVGHAHLDTAWLWPIAETKRKALRTFSSALRLMERFPEFRFLCSQPQQYAWVREASPALFDQIAARVRERRWEPLGAMWIEPDGNLPSGESFVRQIIHGERYFKDAFGDTGPRRRLAYLPDTFGFAASLPQIFRLAGLDTFITNKLWWNETNEFPHTHFVWRGIDGTEIVSHLTPGKEYNATNTPKELRLGQDVLLKKDALGVGAWLQPFGYGDGGGGPTDWTVLNAQIAANCLGLPETNLSGAAEFCRALHERRAALQAAGRDLPVWDGELYLERHRGTYTTQAAIKRGNVRAEADLRIAEWLSFAGPVPLLPAERADAARTLDVAWMKTLLNQFHDILPGSSIGEVYEDAARDHEAVESSCSDLISQGRARWGGHVDTTGMREPVVVFNPGSSAGSGLVACSIGPAERRCYVRDVPAMGVRVVDFAEPAPIEPATVQGRLLSNGIIEATIDEEGRISSLKRCGGRDLAGPGPSGAIEPINQLVLYEDRPRAWEAWDIDADYIDRAEPVSGPVTRCDAVQHGARATLCVERPLGRSSRITQIYALDPGSPVLRIESHVDWHEERRLLRALFPVAVRAPYATYEIPFGHLQRPTTTDSPRERAMFEVPAHRWMDLSEPGLGLAVLNDCKYGHSCRGGVMGLTLLRSPKWPDPGADMGHHRFVYSLMPHDGDWRAAGVDKEAEMMVRPMAAVPLGPGRAGAIKGSWAPLIVHCEGGASVRIATIKNAEDDERLIVRLVECHGRGGLCTINWTLPVSEAESVDLLERPMPLPGLIHKSGTTSLPLRSFQIVTLAVTAR